MESEKFGLPIAPGAQATNGSTMIIKLNKALQQYIEEKNGSLHSSIDGKG